MSENMFKKRKNEDRRKQFIEENKEVADKVLFSATSKNKEREIEDKENNETMAKKKISFFKKEKISKNNYNYYLEDKIDEFITILAELSDASKSELVNHFLKMAIIDNIEIQELAKEDKKIKKALENLNN